jgi:hypothetical protein
MRRIVLAGLFGAWLLAVSIGPILADSPSPTAGPYSGGDTRTAGQGPGLVGSPLYALGGVLAIALISIGLSLVYLRLSPATSEPLAPTGTATGTGTATTDESEPS